QVLEILAGLAETELTPACTAHHVRRLTHRFRTATQHHVRLAEQDLLGTARDRLEAGTAQPVQRECRHLLWHPGAQPDVTRKVDRVRRRLESIPEDDLVDLPGCDAGTLECSLRRVHAEIRCREVLQCAAERAEGRAAP